MIKFLIFLIVLLVLPVTVNAGAPRYHWTMPSDLGDQKFDSPAAACSALISKIKAGGGGGSEKAECRPPHSDVWVNFYFNGTRDVRVFKEAVCADGSKPNIYMPEAQQCPDPPPEECKVDGAEYDITYRVGSQTGPGEDANIRDYTPVNNRARDHADCAVRVTDVVKCWANASLPFPRPAYCMYTVTKTGGKSGGGSPSPTEPDMNVPEDRTNAEEQGNADGSCPRGTVNAGLSSSGIPMCIGQGTAPKNPPADPPKSETEKTETAADGTKTTTKTETITNSDGSKTIVKTVTVTKPDGSKEVSQGKEVTKTPSGGAGKDDSKKQDEKYDLCKTNPNLTICKNSTVGGKCGEISCAGDAIQCATLRAAAALQCQASEADKELKESSSYKLGSSILNGSDPAGATLPNPAGATVIDVPKSLTSDGWLGGGAPFDDLTVDVMGHSLTIPFAEITSHLEFLKYAVMMVASLISFRRISGAVLGA